MGDTARYGGVRASCHVARRGARALRWHMRSNSDNNGTPREADARVLPDSLAHTERAEFASSVTWSGARIGGRCLFARQLCLSTPADELNDGLVDLQGKIRKCCPIRIGANTDDDVRRDVRYEEPRPRQLSESALESIPHHRGLAESRYDQANSRSFACRRHERGSDGPNLEMSGSETLPLLRDTLQFRAPRDACTPRKAQ
jgi:hypothetical protein